MERLNEQLLSAAREGNGDLISECIRGGASINYKSNDGFTPLHLAAGKGHDRSVQILTEGGADLQARDNLSWTPLHLAAWNGHDRSVQILMEFGADGHVRENRGFTPLHLAAEKGQDRSVQIFLEGGVDFQARDNSGSTPLHAAAYNGQDRSVQILMEGGADAHTRDNRGFTPLHLAAEKGQDRSVQILIEGGADVHARTNSAWTPLHLAALKGYDRSVQILTESGADLHARDNWGKSPLDYASEKIQTSIQDTASQIKEFESRFLNIVDTKEFTVLVSKGTYKSYHNRVYFAGACNVGKSTLASNFIGENILPQWKSTDGLIIFFGRNGIDLKSKKMVPLTKGHLESILSSVLRGRPSVEQSESQPSKEQSSRSAKRKGVLKKLKMFFKTSKQPLLSANPLTASCIVLSKESTSSVPKSDEFMTKEEGIVPSALTRYQLPSQMSKQDPTDMHKRMVEELQRGKYKIQIAPSDLVDFGGQRSFDMTHQLFIQQKGAFVLLLDSRKDFDEVLPEYEPGDITTRHIILHWVNSILTYCSIDNNDIYPLIVFAATHKDELTKVEQHKKTTEITTQLAKMFSRHQLNERIKFDQLFLINATDRKDPGVESLKEYLVSLAFQQKSWGERMPIAWVPLELQMAEMRSNNIFILSIEELMAINMSNDNLSLSDGELKHFLRCQHSFGQILYFNVHRLDRFIIVQPTAMVDILRSFITDEMFWPSEPSLHTILSTASKQGIIKRSDLYQLWEQEDFIKYVPSPEIREFTARVLVHLDILVDPKRFHETEDSLAETFMVPCMIKQHFPYPKFPYNLDYGKTIFLSYKLSKSTIPNALVYKMIGAALNIWPLKKTEEMLGLYDKAAILSIDQENDLYLIYSEDRFIVGLSNAKSKTDIPPDIASVIQECLTLTLTKVFTFYYKGFGNSGSSLEVPDCFETEVVIQCGVDECFIPISAIKDKSQWTCQHNRKHSTKFQLYWVFDQKREMCMENCTGLDTKYLDEIPEDKHLIRLARCIGREFYDFIIHLGLKKIEWNDIEDSRAYDDKLTQRFLGLCKWKLKQKARNISPTFRDLSKALSGIKYSEHFLCQVFREERTEVFALNSRRLQEVPDDYVLRELSHNIGYHTFELGIELGLRLLSIEETAFRYSKDMYGQTFDILIKWKTSSKVQPTIRSLMHALQYVDSRGFNFLKEKYGVEQKL